MKEVFEKIINYIHSEIARTTSYAEHDTLINVKFFVEGLAEEYNKKYEPTIDLLEYGVEGYNSHLKEQYRKGYADAKKDNGWIPCSERLPEEAKLYEVTIEKIICSQKQYITDYCLFGTEGEWISRGKVVAWREKVKPYQPKGE